MRVFCCNIHVACLCMRAFYLTMRTSYFMVPVFGFGILASEAETHALHSKTTVPEERAFAFCERMQIFLAQMNNHGSRIFS